MQSPDPVASCVPVGEKAAQRIGEACPDKVDEHRVAGRTLKIA